jgi:hypothetical protein
LQIRAAFSGNSDPAFLAFMSELAVTALRRRKGSNFPSRRQKPFALAS